MTTVKFKQRVEDDPELGLLKSMIIASWRENRPREFSQLSATGQLRAKLNAKVSVVWELHRAQIAQACTAFESQELLRDSISLPLEDDHPWALMDLCDDLEELDVLLDERERAIAAGGEVLIAWDVKVTHLRLLRGLD